MTHECLEKFPTRKIDDCSGEGFNKCYGTSEMKLDVWVESKDGHENYYDDWITLNVNYCPFCGLKSKK